MIRAKDTQKPPFSNTLGNPMPQIRNHNQTSKNRSHPPQPYRQNPSLNGHCLITIVAVLLSFTIGIFLNSLGLFPGRKYQGQEPPVIVAPSGEGSSSSTKSPEIQIQLSIRSPDTQAPVQSLVIYPGDDLPVLESVPGFQFSGWNTSIDGSGLQIDGGDVFDFELTQSIVLYSQWVPQESQTATEPTIASIPSQTIPPEVLTSAGETEVSV